MIAPAPDQRIEGAMSRTGYRSFDTTVDKTNRILKKIEESYGWPKERRNQSYNALRAVLHALRDRLTVDESADFAAQLPMLVRGVYYDGWDPSRVPKKMNRDDFLDQIRNEVPYQVNGGAEGLVTTVAQALRLYKFPYGDFENVHRCGVIAAEVRAAQRKYADIEVAAAHLHGRLDELM
jgi:uncharacterized protein (DUF2267 family)